MQLALLLSIPLSAAVTVWLLHASAALPPPADALRATAVELDASPALDPRDLPGTGASAVELPHDWRGSFPFEQAWYRFHVDLQVPPERLWGIFIPFVEQNAAVYLNGRIVGRRGELDPYPSRFATTPLYFPLPSGLVRSGRNEIAIRVKSYPPGRGYLGPVLLGPDAHLAAFHVRSTFIRSNLLWFFAAGSVAMTFIVAFIAWRRPAEPLYRWFALQFLLWSLLTGKSLVTSPWLPPWWIDALGYVVTTWFCAASFLFAFRFMDTRRPLLERTVLAAASAGAIAVVVAATIAPLQVYTVGPLSTLAQMGLGLAVVWILIRRFLVTRDPELFLVVYAGAIIMIFGTMSFRVSAGAASPISGQFLLYATPLILGAFVVLLLNRFIRALETAEDTTAALEQRVAEKTAELTANHERLREMERARVLAEERERMMREMHDGMGGQLVSAIAQLRRVDGATEVLGTLESALTDLRLMIDSLEDVDGDLDVVLGMLRQRLQPQLEGAGLAVDWIADELPRSPHGSPEFVLHLMRIVQEALTNVVKHADAKTVRVRISCQDGGISVCVEDDGRGLTANGGAGNGRGLAHMRRRAARLNAALSIEPLTPGTRVTLRLPVAPSHDDT